MFNSDNRIGPIMDRQECKKHGAPKGIPCFHLYTGKAHAKILPGICNQRAVRAGANGKISDSSYTSKARILRAKADNKRSAA